MSLLIFAYIVRSLPEAVGASKSSLLQVNPHTEEAARSLGRGPVEVFTKVTAPQILPGMAAGASLIFLTTLKELPATLLLSPFGFETLATRIWSHSQDAQFALAALPSLVLLLTAGLPLAILTIRAGRYVRE
jgi:iron(III) transport system permease protein